MLKETNANLDIWNKPAWLIVMLYSNVAKKYNKKLK